MSRRVGAVLGTAVECTQQVGRLMDQLDVAAAEEAQGIAQIHGAVTELDRVTQGNAASSEQFAASSQQTASQVVALRNLVRRFKLRSATEGNAVANVAERKPVQSAR